MSEVSAARGAACRAVGVAAGATLAFDDSTLNRAKWFTRLIHAGGTRDRLNDEKQRYRDNHHPIASGVVVNTGTTSTVGEADPGLDTRFGGARAGRHGIDDSAFPQSLDVDWLRACRQGP